jgi:hypothetical protein
MKPESTGELYACRSGTSERGATPPPEARRWPQCEPASTHFELGSASERPTAVMAKRYTPRYGVRKE